MINIEDNQIVTYGNNRSVTVYRDFSSANTYYIVPEPVIPLDDDGLPEFALVRYTDGADVAGTCSFQTELQVSADALAAVKAKLGGGITISQFDWQSVSVTFSFSTATSAGLALSATPSMYGANRASFVVHLPDAATYAAFENAFSPDGSAAGTFVLEYDVTALTRLPPAVVTVEFNSQTAYDYQKTISVSKNTWGHVTSRTIAIREHLQQSKAGKVTVTPGGSPLDAATSKRLQAWGNATLESDLEQAAAAADRMMDGNTADTFDMSAVASFRDVYEEGQVVPWYITPRAPIPAFSREVWPKVSSSVSTRNLKAAFTVQDLTRNAVASVELVVTYPLGGAEPAANNTCTFTPNSPSSWIFSAPGRSKAGVFDGTYSYHYVVNYADGSAPFRSAEIQANQSEVHITANDLNILLLEFRTDNVPFKSEGATGDALVDYVLVDLFFINQTSGQPIQFQQARLDAAKPNHLFKSPTHEPFANPCSYRLTYVLDGARQVVIDWQRTSLAAPASPTRSRAPVLILDSPFQSKTVSLFPLPPAGKQFAMVAISATYTDAINDLNEQHSWALTDFTSPPDGWHFLAPANKNVQVVSFQGSYVLDGVPNTVQAAKTSQAMFVLSPEMPLFSVEVDPSQVEWKNANYTQVVVTLYTKSDSGEKQGVMTLEPFHPENTLTQLYSYYFDASKSPECFYTAEYWVKDQPQAVLIGETQLSAQARLTLPGKPNVSQAKLARSVQPSTAL